MSDVNNPPSTPETTLALNTPQSFQFETDGEQENFRFYAKAYTAYRFDVAGPTTLQFTASATTISQGWIDMSMQHEMSRAATSVIVPVDGWVSLRYKDPGAPAGFVYSINATTTTVKDTYTATAQTTGYMNAQDGLIGGVLATQGERDWIKVYLYEGYRYAFQLYGNDTGPGNGNLSLDIGGAKATLRLLNGDEALASASDGAYSGAPRISYSPSASGFYYLEVGGGSGTGSYFLSSVASKPVDVDDHTENRAATTALLSNGSVTAKLDKMGDGDWFAVHMIAGVSYRLTASSINGENYQGSASMELMDTYGQPLQLFGTTAKPIDYSPATSGYYMLRVTGPGALPGTYTIKNSVTADDYADTAATATTLTPRSVLNGKLEFAGDVDVFKVSMPANASYDISIADAGGAKTGADTTLYQAVLLDANENPVGTPVTIGVGQTTQLRASATKAATYYVKLSTVGDASGKYTLALKERDITAPFAPVITAKTERITPTSSSSSLQVSGSAEAGALVRVTLGSKPLGEARADASGKWSLQVAETFSEGQYALSAVAIDAAGNVSLKAGTYFTVSGLLPSTPTLTCQVEKNGFLGGNTAALSGVADAGASVRIFDGKVELGRVIADDKGTWNFQTSKLDDGSHDLTALAVNSLGYTSAAVAALTLRVDTTAPAAPAVLVEVNTQGQVTSNQPRLTGASEAFAVIKLSENGKVLGQTTADADGAWSFTHPLLGNGEHVVDAQAIDTAGNVSAMMSRRFVVASAQNHVSDAGNIRLKASAGNHVIDTGAGIDTIQFDDARSAYLVTTSSDGITVTHAQGTHQLQHVERVQFKDTALAFDVSAGEHGGTAYRLYQAAFNRTPDAAGIGYWLAQLDQGTSANDIAASFVRSAEFVQLIGGATSNANAFLSKLYENVLHRTPDKAGYDYWLGVMSNGVQPGDVLLSFSESAENQAQVANLIAQGFNYTPFG